MGSSGKGRFISRSAEVTMMSSSEGADAGLGIHQQLGMHFEKRQLRAEPPVIDLQAALIRLR